MQGGAAIIEVLCFWVGKGREGDHRAHRNSIQLNMLVSSPITMIIIISSLADIFGSNAKKLKLDHHHHLCH